MGKKKKPKQEVVAYGMSIHFGICSGPVDYLSNLIVDEKRAWPGNWPQMMTEQLQISMDLPDLFGGEKKEGGLAGLVTWLPGEADQTIPANLASKFGRTTATMPAYRGIASMFFSGPGVVHGGTDLPGFYWRANSPYLPGVWTEVGRASTPLGNLNARIYRSITEGSTTPGLDLGVVGFGGAPSKWDTLGPYAVWGGDSGVHGYGTVWDVPGGTSRTFTEANTTNAGLTDSVHLTDDLELMLMTGGIPGPDPVSLEFLDPATLLATQSPVNVAPWLAAVGAIDYFNFGAVADDITSAGGQRVMIVGCNVNSYGAVWVKLTKNSITSNWVISDSSATTGMTGTDRIAEISMGMKYAYGRHGELSTVELLDWEMMTQTTVTPAGIAGRTILFTHYVKGNNQVIIVCINGDILLYNADLTALLAQNLSFNINLAGLTCKRLELSGGRFAIIDASPYSIRILSTSTLGLLQTYDIATSNFCNKGTLYSFMGVNATADGVFMMSHGDESSFWFFPPLGIFDSNPAHIIYECLVNTGWGMGAPPSAIDFANFTAAAATLYAERFGLSIIWTQQASIEDFITEVLDHIEATLFVNPRTGLLTLKLIRNDYSVPSLPVFTPDNSVVSNFSRKLWGETINEIVVTWTNPANEEEETVVAQDLANIEAQGGVVSDGRNYYGVRRANLAMRLAHRDLRSASTPLAKCDIEINRTAWDLLPGDCCVLDSPDDGIDAIVMRIGPVDYGKPGDSTVRTSLVEDVFSLALADYEDPPESEWVDPSEDPSAADHTKIVTLPYYVAANLIDASIVAGVDYPEVFAGVLASEAGLDTETFELYGQAINAAGATSYVNFGTKNITSRATLAAPVAAEIETTILSFPDRTQGNGPIVGGLMLIEGTDETTSEICLISDLGVSGYVFTRGVLDTVPRAWAAGTPVWFIDESSDFIDDVDIRAEGETVHYKVLPTTSRGTLSIGGAPVSSGVMTARPHLPLRPANVLVNGDSGFAGAIDCIGVDPIPVVWARRNRTTETAIIKAWTDGDVTPEAGQTTTVTLTDTAGAVLHTYSGITGTSQSVDPADFGSASEGYIVVSSVRDGLDSLQAWRAQVLVATTIVAVTGVEATVSIGVVTVVLPVSYTTFNPADKGAVITLSGGNLTASSSGSASVRAVKKYSTGKYYIEFSVITLTAGGVGLANASAPLDIVGNWFSAVTAAVDGTIYMDNVNTGKNIGAVGSGNLVGIAVDLGAKLVWFRKGASGNWNGNASYAPDGTGGVDITTIMSTGLYPYAFLYSPVGSSVTANFGGSAFTGTVPSGYTAGWPA